MRKSKLLFFLFPTALAFGALSFATPKQSFARVQADDDKKVSINIANDGGWNPYGWGSHGVSDDGLTDTVTANNQANMWGSGFLDFSKHENIEIEVSFSAYDSTEDPIGYSSDGLDIYIKSADNSTVYGIFRIWSQGWGTYNGTHPVKLWEDEWGEVTETFDSTGGGQTNVILGDAISSSSFKLRFNRTHGIEFWNVWEKWGYSANQTVTDRIVERMNSADTFSLVFTAEGGFARGVTVTLKSYNGQSFANSGGYFTDDVAPEIMSGEGGSIAAYQPFNCNATAWDVFDGDVNVNYLDSADQAISMPYYFKESGSETVKIVAVDSKANSSNKQLSYTVGNITAESFAAWLLMDHGTQSCSDKYNEAKLAYRSLSPDENTTDLPIFKKLVSPSEK